jgi:hypothetical protein
MKRQPSTAVARTANQYRRFAQSEARGKSPLYETLAEGVAADSDLLTLLASQPPEKRQPNLLFAAVAFLGGRQPDYASFRALVLDRADEVRSLMQDRQTQTNEVGRCATLLPALGRLPGPLALLEVGASAGLCLLLDRYTYRYGRHIVGDGATVIIECDVRGEVPLPHSVPEVVWRCGIDLDPPDLLDEADVRWLESCIWPDQHHRLQRLRAALKVAQMDPPSVLQGDLLEMTLDIVTQAPQDATLVVFHSATLAYLRPEARATFAEMMAGAPGVWLSNEAPGVIEPLVKAVAETPDEPFFVIGQGGHEVLGFAGPHGEWIDWRAFDHGRGATRAESR